MSGSYSGRLFDGRVATARSVVVTVGADRLDIAGDDGPVESWVFKEIERSDEPGGFVWVHGDARLIVEGDAFQRALRSVAPALFPRPFLRAALFSLPVLAAAALWFGWGALVDFAVDHFPDRFERELANTVLPGVKPCATSAEPGPLAALTRVLTERRGYRAPPEIWIVPGDMVNAVTLPAGRILVFDGLVRKAGSVDQIAGVLAHELAHFEARDPIRLFVSSLGLQVLGWGLLGGGTSASLGEALLLTGYGRDAERVADDRAVDILAEAGLRSDGLSRFLEEFAAAPDSPLILTYFQTHPGTAERVARLRARETTSGRSALDGEAWERVRRACGNGR